MINHQKVRIPSDISDGTFLFCLYLYILFTFVFFVYIYFVNCKIMLPNYLYLADNP